MLKAYVTNPVLFGKQALVFLPCTSGNSRVYYERHILLPSSNSSFRLVSDVFEFDYQQVKIDRNVRAGLEDFMVTQLSCVEEACMLSTHKLLFELFCEVAVNQNLDLRLLKNVDLGLEEMDFDLAIERFLNCIDKHSLLRLLDSTNCDLFRSKLIRLKPDHVSG